MTFMTLISTIDTIMTLMNTASRSIMRTMLEKGDKSAQVCTSSTGLPSLLTIGRQRLLQLRVRLVEFSPGS